MTPDTVVKILHFVLYFILLTFIVGILAMTYKQILKVCRGSIRKLYSWQYVFRKELREFTYRFSLLIRFKNVLKHSYRSHTIELIFETYKHFYDTHFSDIEGMDYPENDFTHGKADLVHMYKWISKIRENNYSELDSLSFKKERVLYERGRWDGFFYKIKEGILQITPYEADADTNHNERKYMGMRMKLDTDLYDLDNEMANWIILRRKYFGV